MNKETTGGLEGKVAVITGGNSGIGLATAVVYHNAGAKVVITARSASSYEKAQTDHGDKFDVVKADVTNIDDIKNLAKVVSEKYGKIDILFANAGVAFFSPLEMVDNDAYDSLFDTNVKGLFFTIQQLTPIINKGGSIIITSSALNVKGMAGASVYTATKAAVRSFARTLSAELLDRGIRVNTLSPGPVATPIFGKMGMDEEQLQGMKKQVEAMTPLGRFGQPEEIAKVALFLGSDDSSFMLGSEVTADGGVAQL